MKLDLFQAECIRLWRLVLLAEVLMGFVVPHMASCFPTLKARVVLHVKDRIIKLERHRNAGVFQSGNPVLSADTMGSEATIWSSLVFVDFFSSCFAKQVSSTNPRVGNMSFGDPSDHRDARMFRE